MNLEITIEESVWNTVSQLTLKKGVWLKSTHCTVWLCAHVLLLLVPGAKGTKLYPDSRKIFRYLACGRLKLGFSRVWIGASEVQEATPLTKLLRGNRPAVPRDGCSLIQTWELSQLQPQIRVGRVGLRQNTLFHYFSFTKDETHCLCLVYTQALCLPWLRANGGAPVLCLNLLLYTQSVRITSPVWGRRGVNCCSQILDMGL